MAAAQEKRKKRGASFWGVHTKQVINSKVCVRIWSGPKRVPVPGKYQERYFAIKKYCSAIQYSYGTYTAVHLSR